MSPPHTNLPMDRASSTVAGKQRIAPHRVKKVCDLVLHLRQHAAIMAHLAHVVRAQFGHEPGKTPTHLLQLDGREPFIARQDVLLAIEAELRVAATTANAQAEDLVRETSVLLASLYGGPPLHVFDPVMTKSETEEGRDDGVHPRMRVVGSGCAVK
jgi:hypothetical protein